MHRFADAEQPLHKFPQLFVFIASYSLMPVVSHYVEGRHRQVSLHSAGAAGHTVPGGHSAHMRRAEMDELTRDYKVLAWLCGKWRSRSGVSFASMCLHWPICAPLGQAPVVFECVVDRLRFCSTSHVRVSPSCRHCMLSAHVPAPHRSALCNLLAPVFSKEELAPLSYEQRVQKVYSADVDSQFQSSAEAQQAVEMWAKACRVSMPRVAIKNTPATTLCINYLRARLEVGASFVVSKVKYQRALTEPKEEASTMTMTDVVDGWFLVFRRVRASCPHTIGAFLCLFWVAPFRGFPAMRRQVLTCAI